MYVCVPVYKVCICIMCVYVHTCTLVYIQGNSKGMSFMAWVYARLLMAVCICIMCVYVYTYTPIYITGEFRGGDLHCLGVCTFADGSVYLYYVYMYIHILLHTYR